MNFTIEEAYLVGDWTESALWGLYTAVFGYAVYSIYVTHKAGLRRINWITTGAIIACYLLATAHLALAFHRLITAFIVSPDKLTTILYLSNIADPVNRSKDMVYITVLVLTDCILVWRCYVVWSKSLLAIAGPVIMLLATAIAGYAAIGQYFLVNPDLTTTLNWGTAQYAISLGTNVIVTTMIAGRILWMKRGISGPGFGNSKRLYRQTLLLVIESGLVITVCKIIEFVLFQYLSADFAGGRNQMYILFETMPQVSGMVQTITIAAVNARLVGGYNSTHSHSISTPSRPYNISTNGFTTSAVNRGDAPGEIVFDKSWRSPNEHDEPAIELVRKQDV